MGKVIRAHTLVLAVFCLIVAGCSDATDRPPTEPSAEESSTVPEEGPAATDDPSGEDDMTDETDAPDRSLPPDTTLERVPPTQPPIIGEVPTDLLDPVRADAVERTGIELGDLKVVRSEAVAWNDGSLGCAEPGQVYTQAIVLGFWIEIDAGGRILDYRANDEGFFKLCEGPVVQPPPTTAPNR